MKQFLQPLILILSFLGTTVAVANPQLAVYYGTTLSVKEREKVLKARLQEEEIVVFARSKDFEQTLQESPVPLVIAPSLFEELNSDYEPVLQLITKDKRSFEYKIVALKGKNIQLKQSTLGLIEEVQRKKMKDLMSQKVGIVVNRINTVSKPEDLFPLLVFRAADAIAVSEENYMQLIKQFTTEVISLPSEVKPIPYPRVYIRKGTHPELLKKLENMDPNDLNALGFDKIERITK